jgi:hypothetical protein
MPDIQPGDIVTVRNKPQGYWTVLEFTSSFQWRVLHDYGHRGGAVRFDASPGDVELLLRPVLSPGLELRLNDKRVTVIETFGNKVKVEIAAEDRREPLPGGGHVAFGIGQAVIGKGELISENASQLLRSQAGG